MLEALKAVPGGVQLLLMSLGMFCGSIGTWAIMLRKTSFLEYRANLAERLLGLSKKHHEEDRARYESYLEFEREHVRVLQKYADSLVNEDDGPDNRMH